MCEFMYCTLSFINSFSQGPISSTISSRHKTIFYRLLDTSNKWLWWYLLVLSSRLYLVPSLGHIHYRCMFLSSSRIFLASRLICFIVFSRSLEGQAYVCVSSGWLPVYEELVKRCNATFLMTCKTTHFGCWLIITGTTLSWFFCRADGMSPLN